MDNCDMHRAAKADKKSGAEPIRRIDWGIADLLRTEETFMPVPTHSLYVKIAAYLAKEL